ncbi:MAG: PLP-dependent transferase [Pseudomonadota bacterium]
MSKSNSQKPETIAARLSGFTDAGSGGVVPPMQPSTTFVRDEDYNLVYPENSYGRDNNDQVRLAEKIICQLEGGEDSLLFGSGMAAISVLFSSLKRGEKLIVQSGIYWGTTAHIRSFCEHREITLIEADASDTDALTQLVSREEPAMVFVETPSNPWIKVCDVAALAVATKQASSFLAVDATAATPVLMQPLAMGADVVVHSATKAINGHSDVLAGVLTCSDTSSRVWQHVTRERHGAGAILSAQAAWLLIRGMRTLPLRMARMCENALEIARFLDGHEKVSEVWYPGLETHNGHSLAKRQMHGGFGYLMSFLVRGGKEEALAFCRHLHGIHRATSLGGTESLVEHRHTIEGDLTGCPENLIRLSVGIENLEDLKSELDDALSKT